MTPDGAPTIGDLSPKGKKLLASVFGILGIGLLGAAVMPAKYRSTVAADGVRQAEEQAKQQQRFTADALAGKSGSLLCSVDHVPNIDTNAPVFVTIPATDIAATNPKSTLRVYLSSKVHDNDCRGIPGP